MLKMFELYSLYNTSGAKCVPSDHFICLNLMNSFIFSVIFWKLFGKEKKKAC